MEGPFSDTKPNLEVLSSELSPPFLSVCCFQISTTTTTAAVVLLRSLHVDQRMDILRVHQHHPQFLPISKNAPSYCPPSMRNFPSRKFPPFYSPSLSSLSLLRPTAIEVSKIEASVLDNSSGEEEEADRENDLAKDGVVYRNTLRLVECAMFAAVTGLVYFLSNSLSIENYFGCFFSLPIVISSLRWGVAGGRKTMVATAMLLFVLSGPVKALTYLLTHGLVGFTMGSLWRLGVNWGLSIFLCTIARSMGAVGYVLTTSFLIRENILALITVNFHASLTYIFAAIGINIVPSMNAIYVLFGILVLLNSGFFVFLLHLLYSVFLARLGMRDSLRLPGWLERAI